MLFRSYNNEKPLTDEDYQQEIKVIKTKLLTHYQQLLNPQVNDSKYVHFKQDNDSFMVDLVILPDDDSMMDDYDNREDYERVPPVGLSSELIPNGLP